MIDFANIPKSENKPCQDCEQTFRGLPQESRCVECQYDADHPDQAPKYWTWTRRGSGVWGAVATWPEQETLPNVGDTIDIHRKDGRVSTNTITEVDGLRYDMMGRARLHCWVT